MPSRLPHVLVQLTPFERTAPHTPRTASSAAHVAHGRARSTSEARSTSKGHSTLEAHSTSEARRTSEAAGTASTPTETQELAPCQLASRAESGDGVSVGVGLRVAHADASMAVCRWFEGVTSRLEGLHLPLECEKVICRYRLPRLPTGMHLSSNCPLSLRRRRQGRPECEPECNDQPEARAESWPSPSPGRDMGRTPRDRQEGRRLPLHRRRAGPR